MTGIQAAFVLTTLLFMAPPASPDVLTVGPGGDFPEIQDAVDVASDLDIVLVSTGSYGPVTIGDVAVTVVADVGEAAHINGGVTVQGLSAGRAVSLIGLDLTLEWEAGGSIDLERPTLELAFNAGPVRVDQCTIASNQNAFTRVEPSASMAACADVAFARTDLLGGVDGSIAPLPPGEGTPPTVTLSTSTVVFHGGSIVGSSGHTTSDGFFTLGGTGGVGLSLSNGSVFLSGTSITGGMGSPGGAQCEFVPGWDGGPGGPGIEILGPGAIVRQLDTDVTGGPGAEGNPVIFCFGTAAGPAGAPVDH
jgi:hypothetical protein